MRATIIFFVLCAIFATISCQPEVEGEASYPPPPYGRYNPYSYNYMMCRLQCRQSCLEQGYYKGVCKQGACYCFGLMGPYGRMNAFPMPNY